MPLTDDVAVASVLRCVAWGNAWVRGWCSLEEASSAIAAGDPGGRVAGLPGLDGRPWRKALPEVLGPPDDRRGFRLVLPRPGRGGDLPGPAAVNATILAHGSGAVVVGHAGVVVAALTSERPDGISWTWLNSDAEPPSGPPVPSVAEAERALARAVREATDVLLRLDVAQQSSDGWAAAEGAPSVRGGRLPRTYPARARDLAHRAWTLMAALSVAGSDDGAAVSASEAAVRQSAVRSVEDAARVALVAAYSSPTLPG